VCKRKKRNVKKTLTTIVVYDIIISKGVDVMYTVEDLFDKRSVVGARIEQLMLEKQYTKTNALGNRSRNTRSGNSQIAYPH